MGPSVFPSPKKIKTASSPLPYYVHAHKQCLVNSGSRHQFEEEVRVVSISALFALSHEYSLPSNFLQPLSWQGKGFQNGRCPLWVQVETSWLNGIVAISTCPFTEQHVVGFRSTRRILSGEPYFSRGLE